MEERNGTKRDAARLLNGWRSLLSVSLLEGKAKLVFKAQAKRERGPIGDAERRKQLGLLRDESWAVRAHQEGAYGDTDGRHRPGLDSRRVVWAA